MPQPAVSDCPGIRARHLPARIAAAAARATTAASPATASLDRAAGATVDHALRMK